MLSHIHFSYLASVSHIRAIRAYGLLTVSAICFIFALYAISFLFCGFNIWSSGFFTALNDGFVSAAIAFGRTFLFQGLAVLLLPGIWGLDGCWMSMVFAEAATLAVAATFFRKKKDKYHYA